MKKVIAFCLVFCIICSCIVFAETNNSLSYVIEPQYYSALEFNKHGIAQVQLEPAEEFNEGVMGVINLKGERIFGFDGTKFAIRKNGLIMALGDNDKAAFFSSEGVQLTDYVYETFKRVQPKTPHLVTYNYLTDMHDGDGESDLVPICRDGKFGFINSKGEEAIEPKFDYVFGFNEGLSRIGYNGILSEYGTYTDCKFGYVNEKGEVLPSGELWAAEDFVNGYAKIADGQYKVIDKSGREVHFPIGGYEFLETNGNFILASDRNNGYVVFDMSGKVLSGADTGYKFLFGKSFVIDRKQIADINGNIIYTAPEGVEINDCRKGSYVTTISTSAVINRLSIRVDGLINQDGIVLIEPCYKGLREVSDGVFYTQDTRSLFDTQGKSIAEIEGYDVTAYYDLSYKLLPVKSYENHLWGYVELPAVGEEKENNESFESKYDISQFMDSTVYKIYDVFDTDYGAVVYYSMGGMMRAPGPGISLVRENGDIVGLSVGVSKKDLFRMPVHNDIKLSEDGKYITFNVSFDERAEGPESMLGGDTIVYHDAGTYYYKSDLEKGVTIETHFEPKDTLGDDVISSWAKPEVIRAIEHTLVPNSMRENYTRNITRQEFARLAMSFLSYQYGYAANYPIEFWQDPIYDESRADSIDDYFVRAYCAANPDRNGNPFLTQNGDVFEGNKNGINFNEPFEKTDDFAYYNSVKLAYNFGVVNGISDTEFNPTGDITRQEAAAMLMRVYKNYAEYEKADSDFAFADDADIADWAREDVYGINSLGVMQGVGGDRFAPLDNYTVEQAIATFLRLYESAPTSRKNKNIAPLLTMETEKEKRLEGFSGYTSFTIKDEFKYEDYTIIYGVWSERREGSTDTIYVFYNNGGVKQLTYGVDFYKEITDIKINPDDNTISYNAHLKDTFKLYNKLCGTEKVYDKGEYRFCVNIETGNIVWIERIS